MGQWKTFPHDATPFLYEGDALERNWASLHRGDRVPFPGEAWVRQSLEAAPRSVSADFDGDTIALADLLQSAWRHFHAGAFQTAVEQSDRCGLLAHACANKASGIHATYLEEDEEASRACFLQAADRAEQAAKIFPDDANAHYFRAFNLGRYGQSISIVEALKRGMAGKIHESLENTLELEPDHAEAHTAMGMYHAEIINKVGKMIGGMTYGASAGKALEHFEKALELTPDAPIANIEYGNGLYLLYGDRKLDEVTDLYIRASEMEPRDAMEKLDVESALAELE